MRCARPGRAAKGDASPSPATARRAVFVRRSRPRPSARSRRSTTKARTWRAASSCAWSNCGPMAKTRGDGPPGASSSTSTEQRSADVVATLTDARLLVVDRDQITLVHEALLRAWPRLGTLDRGATRRAPRAPGTARRRRAMERRRSQRSRSLSRTATRRRRRARRPRSPPRPGDGVRRRRARAAQPRIIRDAAPHATTANPRRRHLHLGGDRAAGRRGRDRPAQRRPGFARCGRSFHACGADRSARRPRRFAPRDAARHGGAARHRGVPPGRYARNAIDVVRHLHRRRAVPRCPSLCRRTGHQWNRDARRKFGLPHRPVRTAAPLRPRVRSARRPAPSSRCRRPLPGARGVPRR